MKRHSTPSASPAPPAVAPRREFLIAGASASVLAAGGFAYLWYDNAPAQVLDPVDPVERVKLVVAERLPYLRVQSEALQTFAEAYVAWADTRGRSSKRDIVERFLKSTDFFQHGGDENRELRLVAFYDPYRAPCYDPFNQKPR